MSTSPVGFALAGLGLVGPAHARSLREIEDAELRVVCDVNVDAAKSFAAEYGCDWTSDFIDVVARDDVDIVSIATPPFTHLELGTAAAKAGKHIVVEKPIEITMERAQQLVDVCADSNVKLGIIFQSRWKKSFMLLKKAVDEGKLGKLLLGDVYVKWFRPQEYYESSAWRGTWSHEGGGALINQSSHSIDVLQWLMGPVASLFAYFTTSPLHDIEVEDLATATLRFKSGALGVIEGATALRPGLPERVEIHGEKGTVIVEGGTITCWQVDGMDEEQMKHVAEEPTGSGASDPMAFPISWHKAQLQDMIDAVRECRAPAVDGEEGMKALRIIRAVYESGRTGKEVTF